MTSDVAIRRYLALGGLVLELVVCPTLTGQATKSPSSISVPSEVTSWFKSAAMPLDSTSPESGLDDLRQMESTIGNARIVAMGEATHGTREFFQLKHRMLEFLVEKKGFTVFGIEANWPESLAINDYVLNGTNDAGGGARRFVFLDLEHGRNAGHDPMDAQVQPGSEAHEQGKVFWVRHAGGALGSEECGKVPGKG